MRRLALIVLIVSPILAIFTTTIHEIHTYVDFFDSFYPAIETYLRFHQLTLMIGLLLLGLSISKKEHKILLFFMSAILLFQIFLNELMMISLFTWSYTIITFIFLSLLSIYILHLDQSSHLTSKYEKHLALCCVSLYFFAMFLYTLFHFDFQYHLHLYAVIYVFYQYALYSIFKTLYMSEFGHLHHLFLED